MTEKYTLILEGTGSIENIEEQFESFLVQISKTGHAIDHVSLTSPIRNKLGEPKLTSIEISPKSVSIEIGENKQLTSIFKDQYGNIIQSSLLTWHTNNKEVATVDSTGKVYGKSTGTADITASYNK